MARYLLDSDAVIDWLKRVSPSVALIGDLERRGDVLCTCDIVIAEVFSGLPPGEHGPAEALFSGLAFLPATPAAARRAGEWRYAYARQGLTLPTTDVLIAATAHAHQATVVTGNRSDYPMPEVEVLPLPR